jgi:tetratricopeptide (TPR) repeat protein
MRLRSLLGRFIGRSATWLVLLLAPAIAHANNEDLARKLASYEAEAAQLGQNLPTPNASSATPRRLVDAEVAYSLGDYDTAALMLFDIVGTNPNTNGPEGDQAVFYLADSLYAKGDRGAAHGYFTLLANNSSGRYYTRALERLVELAIVQNDPANVDAYLAKLGSSPYIHGKWMFAQKKYDDAIGFFNQVGAGERELQAQYYLGAAAVAKGDLARATEIYTTLVDRKPKSSSDRRVIELAQLALGRVYYEREQPAKSIDAYLLVDRHSDLFPDALYEVSWVYVKSKQYDKALKALELLEKSLPQSTRNATMRLLEGNLRIRKAQLLRTSQINGTINANEKDDPASEYDKADQIFGDTHTQYAPAYDALSRVIANASDPGQLVDQVSGRNAHVFQIVAPIPDAAMQWLREDPAVQRVLSVENDLRDIQVNIDQTEAMLARLEGVVAAGARANAYPQLAARRARLAVIADDIIRIRAELADQQLALVGTPGDLGRLSANRKQAVWNLTGLQATERQAGARIVQDNAAFDRVDDATIEVDGIIGGAQGMAVALRKYVDENDKVPDDVHARIHDELDAVGKEAVAIEDELAQIRREASVGRDLARVVDDSSVQARQGRAAAKVAEDEEARALAGFAASARDSKKAQELARLDDRAARVAEQLAAVDAQIERLIAQGLDQVRTTVASARKDLADYKRELAELSAESRQSGGAILGASFHDVKAKLYDVVIRSDVGTVDVAWSQKEDSDDDLKRLTLSRARELKQLKDEFRDVLEQAVPAPQPKKKAVAPVGDQPKNEGSPDQGGGGNRVSPGDASKKGSTQQTVKPDEQKKQPNKTPQKTQPSKKGGGR